MAEWDTAYINDLPDSAFACIDAGGEKEDGKTVPRSLRHYPHHNAAGDVDLPHLRNALSRVAQGGTTSCGQDHLEAHARSEGIGEEARSDDAAAPVDVHELTLAAAVQVRSMAKREIDVRLAPFNVAIETLGGPEIIERGAFRNIDPRNVWLMGPEHEVHLGVGHMGEVIPTRRRNGQALSIEERDDGGYATFRVAKTSTGDDILNSLAEGLYDGVSIEMGLKRRVRREKRNGRVHNVVEFSDLLAVAPTYQPAYAEARVLAVRSQEGVAPMVDETTTAAPETNGAATKEHAATLSKVEGAVDDLMSQIAAIRTRTDESEQNSHSVLEKLVDRLEKIEERGRSQFTIPSGEPEKPQATRGQWMSAVMRVMTGQRLPEYEVRALADIITSENVGVVPDSFSTEIIGVIDASRPFMSSTRRLTTPPSGTQLILPKIVTRPTVGEQTSEKQELTSTDTSITTETFNMVTKGGAGDLSLQILRRSSPEFLDLYLELLAEALAIEAETEALEAVMEATGVNGGGALDPEDLSLGTAFGNSFSAFRRGPDTLWVSSTALGLFIDAKASGTNAPLYSNLNANIQATGGISGTISGLRVVHVPAMDATANDVIVGPSTGFAWAEDGTYTLQVDVPAKAGRDVALVSMYWFAPLYPSAFTVYTVAGGGS